MGDSCLPGSIVNHHEQTAFFAAIYLNEFLIISNTRVRENYDFTVINKFVHILFFILNFYV